MIISIVLNEKILNNVSRAKLFKDSDAKPQGLRYCLQHTMTAWLPNVSLIYCNSALLGRVTVFLIYSFKGAIN